MLIQVMPEAVQQALVQADAAAQERGSALEAELIEWQSVLDKLYASQQRTYFPVLCVTLLARCASPDVDVRKVQKRDQEDGYTAYAVGQALVEYCETHEIDVRTDNRGVLNNQPITFKPLITPQISERPDYKVLYDAVERVQALTPQEAQRVLALALHEGREHWSQRTRRRRPVKEVRVATPAEHYFILNQSSDAEHAHYDSDGRYGFHERVTSARALVQAGGGRFVVYRTSGARESAMCFVGHGRIDRVVEQPGPAGERRRWEAHIDEYEDFVTPVPKALGAPPGWNWQHSIVEITREDYQRILAAIGEEVTWSDLEVANLRERCADAGVVVADEVLATLVAALNSGKHVVLTGPPGTAKTTLAGLVAQAAAEDHALCAGHSLTTATADWSTYDTIGGLRPTGDGQLVFSYGHFLEALANNQWLVIDEMNRSNLDRAFGQLFTVLSGQSVVLPYRHSDDDLPVRLRHEADALPADCHDILIPQTWRVIATMNNFDKSLLFELSFALMRRSAFVEVPSPPTTVFTSLCDRQLAGADEEITTKAQAVMRDLLPLRSVKDLGPAVYIDAARLARKLFEGSVMPRGTVALQVFYALLLPQFEGVDEVNGARVLRILKRAVGPSHGQRARAVLQEVLGLDLGQAQEQADALDDEGPLEPTEQAVPGRPSSLDDPVGSADRDADAAGERRADMGRDDSPPPHA